MIVLLVVVLALVVLLLLSKDRTSLWWPALGLCVIGFVGALAFILGMEQATQAQLHNGTAPPGVAYGGAAVLAASAGLLGLALLGLLRRWRASRKEPS